MDRNSKTEEGAKNRPVYKPTSNYQWDEEALISLTGKEVNIILRSLKAAANNEDFVRNVAIFQGLSTINEVFKEMVESGIAKEMEDPPLQGATET